MASCHNCLTPYNQHTQQVEAQSLETVSLQHVFDTACLCSMVEKGTGSPQAASNITTLGFIATW